MIRILGTIFAGLLGLAFGSFLNVCLSRWPIGESVVKPRSHCRQCNRTLTWWENVPLVSWLALRGRCRTCHAWIGWRYPLVEALVAALWANEAWCALFISFGHNPRFISAIAAAYLPRLIFIWLLIALACLDAENFWLPNWITLPGIALGFVYSILYFLAVDFARRLPESGFSDFIVYSFLNRSSFLFDLIPDWFIGVIVPAGLILLIRWVYWLIRRREGIGLGDAILMALLGAWLGLPGALLAFVLGVVLGALVALGQLTFPAARNQSRRWAFGKLPLGTFLCIGGIVSSLWGQAILNAYLRWGGF
jgi:leader peptidase (prepilin peptidase)/N-methyltransferase